MEYEPPKQTISVSALLMNENNEVLLLRTLRRPNTWEMPGGNVEVGEPLDNAVCREFFEETGVVIRPVGITGVYYNATKHVLSVVFKAEYIRGEIKIQPEEIKKAKYFELNENNIDEYITLPQQRSRTLDAMHSKCFIPYETWEVTPTYNLLSRLYNE